MKMLSLLLIFAFSAVLQIPSRAEAFECPEHFKKAGAMIDEATKALKSLEKGSPLFRIVHAAIDDAKMYLAGAKHNHKKPQGDFDHARAIAKADLARPTSVRPSRARSRSTGSRRIPRLPAASGQPTMTS